mgnify:CR=1 FL=1
MQTSTTQINLIWNKTHTYTYIHLRNKERDEKKTVFLRKKKSTDKMNSF